MTTRDSANEIRITRIYDAPVALVWKAWTDLDHVSQWWGPRGFTITTRSKDLRPGGHWHYTMHGPDGTDYPNFARSHEVVPQAKLVYDHSASSADAAPLFHVTATFRNLGAKTEFDMRMTLQSAEEARQRRAFIKAGGGNATWDRLAEHLENAITQKEVFVINRSFEAPVAAVFDCWTNPAHLALWLPPTGFDMVFRHVDIRAGDESAFTMTNGDFTIHARQLYVRVQPSELIEYLQTFTDADGSISRHPGAPLWPETTMVTVQFAEEGSAQTRVTVRFAIVGAATPDEIGALTGERTGMTAGWSASFDALDGVLAGASA